MVHLRVGYARVSDDKQVTDLQTDALKAAGCERIFIETASGAQRNRPELVRALEFVRPGDVLCVWRLDRLARSVRQLVETAEHLAERGIELRSLTEALDSSSPGGRLIFNVFASVAQFERELIVERTKAGLRAARERGRVGGRRPVLTPTKIKAARALLQAGDLSVSDVARQVGCSLTSLYRAFPAARSGAATGEWAAPKLTRTPPVLAPAE